MPMKIQIKKGDIVRHLPSGLFYICENDRQARWMNDKDAFYVYVYPASHPPKEYFNKNK